mmetsp:Transcript_6294/g.9144  ORF Transcript_6294/g.9144 Transcript_6294/m.9144 type:complete len:501 (-) Transcript_6294:357-1859(-)|eukprot:CAMPEP_0184865410 /NCGR_PEP_ID=MMETSP0580-20130426/18010_1 /TAXON_ID=1118495 /ORGANISM="Dactyliosolen fragilissimus" /LENGTH=500 /DNA_ID=CAMNT_0027364607 /DNA_START=19 /DNA_END=1521 /DNA_ORIENTATION=-
MQDFSSNENKRATATEDVYQRMDDVDNNLAKPIGLNKMISFDVETLRRDELAKNDEDRNPGYAASIASSAMTASGISDPVSYYIICFLVFLGDMSRGIFFPTQWNLVKHLGGTEVTLGYAVGSFSFGRILVAPIFGRWSVTYGYKKTLLFCNLLQFIALICYTQVINVDRAEYLVFATALLGVGSSTLPVTRAFVAEVTATRERTTYIAFLTSLQYAGTTVTPFIGSFFVEIFARDDGEINKGLFSINEYIAPAYFMMILSIIAFYLLSNKFVDRKREVNPNKKKSSRRQELERVANERVFYGYLSKYEACLLLCMLLNLGTKGTIACFETMGIEYSETHFGMYRATAGTIVAVCGFIGVLFILSMGQIQNYLNDTEMLYYGMSLVVAAIFMNTFLSEDNDNPTWRYGLMIFFIYGIGYPVGHTALVGLFSKLVGRQPQGPLQGWFSFSGSLARVTFPVMAGYLVNYSGIEALFYFLIVIAGTAVVFTFMFRDILMYLSV